MRLPQLVQQGFRPTRREMLQLMGASAAALMLPDCSKKSTAYSYRFLTSEEVAGLGALADAILPPDSEPGGKELGTTEFVDRLLSAFEGGGPIWAGGPYSGRAPYPAADGTPSKSYPTDDFNQALPMDRVHQLYWKYLIYGSSVQPGPNDGLIGAFDGYRNIVRNGLALCQTQSQTTNKTSLQDSNYQQLIVLINQLINDTTNVGAEFFSTVIPFVTQACFAAPEYGGNANLGGWSIAHYEGDRQPVGFSWYDPATQSYTEDPTYPVSKPNPGADPDPMDPQTLSLVQLSAAFENAGS
jgi:hypothetical protein